MSDTWRVVVDAADDEAYAVLERDRLWNGYAIADLEPPLRQHTRVAVAHRDDRPSAAVLVLRHPDFTATCLHGPPDGIAAIAGSSLSALPEKTFLLARPSHLGAVRQYLHVDLHEMSRMAVTSSRFRPIAGDGRVERLGAADVPALHDLYRLYPESAFTADMLERGVFFGVRDGDALAAAAGTHVLAPRNRLAAVGNIFTRPAARGRGLGLATTAAVVGALFATGYTDVILNVATENATARRIYERLGFREHCRYLEGMARRSC